MSCASITVETVSHRRASWHFHDVVSNTTPSNHLYLIDDVIDRDGHLEIIAAHHREAVLD